MLCWETFWKGLFVNKATNVSKESWPRVRLLQGLRGVFADRMLRQACKVSCCNRICWRLPRAEWQQCVITETRRYTSDGKNAEISSGTGVFWNLNGPWHKTLWNCHFAEPDNFCLVRSKSRKGRVRKREGERFIFMERIPGLRHKKGFASDMGSDPWSPKMMLGVWSLFADGKTKSEGVK